MNLMPKGILKYAAGALLLVGSVLFARSFIGQRDAEWQARVEKEQARAAVALANADSARRKANSLEDDALALILRSQHKDTVVVEKIKRLPAPPPACEEFTAPRDSIIGDLQDQKEIITAAYERQREATDQLRRAQAKAMEAADSLMAVLNDRPRPISPLLPEVGFGGAAGLDITGKPNVVFGVTFSWKVRLF